jgi:hypothetical protein
MRNALRSYNISFASGNENKLASWCDIVEVYGLDSNKINQLRFLPKWTDSHVNLTLGKKMNVRMAANVLSRTTSKAIQCYVEYNQMKSTTALATAEFCDRVNSLFDLCNNSDFLQGVSLLNLESRVEEMQRCIEWLDSLRFYRIGQHKEYKGHSFVQGWQVSLSSFIGLSRMLVGGGQINRLLLRFFTQDHVENGFSCVRRRGGFNDCPEYREAISALSSLAVNSLLGAASSLSNCEEDGAHMLLKHTSISEPGMHFSCSATRSTSQAAVEVSSLETDLDSIFDSVLYPMNLDLTPSYVMTTDTEKNAYVAGWCLRQVFKTCQCELCQKALRRDSTDASDGVRFIKMKQFSATAAEKGAGLLVPSIAVTQFFEQLEAVFYSEINKVSF